jgi:CBS domain-containing protein
MNLNEMFRSETVTVEPSSTIAAAARLMKDKNVGAVIVTRDRKVAGILTDRDVAIRCGTGTVSVDTPVSEIMSKPVITIWNDQGVFNATQYLRGHKIRRLPIIDRQDNLVGILSADDLLGLLARESLNVAQSLEPALGSNV